MKLRTLQILFCLGLSTCLLLISGHLEAQSTSQIQRELLSSYMGQEVLVVDTTSGTEQFHHQDALLLYKVTLDDVRRDYIIVTRDIEGDKRSFLYPLSLVKRVVTKMNGRPLRPIVIEMY